MSCTVIDLQRLIVLRAVAAHESVTAAASALSYSPSAVSQQLARLERELGVELVRRQGRRITMTPLGQELASRAADLLELAEEFEHRATRTMPVRRRLKICAFPRAVPWLVAPALALCRDQLADVEVEVDVVSTSAGVRSVRHGLTHLSLVYGADPALNGSKAQTVATVVPRLTLSVDLGYPPATLRDCAQLPWVLPSAVTPVRAVIDRALATAGVTPLVAATATTLDGVAALVESGLGISLLPAFAFSDSAGRLVSREPLDPTPPVHILAIRRTDHHGMRDLTDLLVETITKVAGAASENR